MPWGSVGIAATLASCLAVTAGQAVASPARPAAVAPGGPAIGTPEGPKVSRIPDAQWAAMRRAGVVRAGCPASRADLRRVEVDFRGFDGRSHRGVLVVNRDVAREVGAIFTDLYRAGFPIRSIKPIEAFGGDDNASMAADNTSAYNCRRASQANSPATKSPHANGRAVDINPRENPWWDPRCACFMPSAKYAKRVAGKGRILAGGPVWKAFTARGWIWQNTAKPDYQHFDTGYPSRPR